MKSNKSLIWALVLLIIVSALYRIIPGRPMGFAPHLAMALFSGAVVGDKKWAFALPVFSLLLSDVIYQLLYLQGVTAIPGFYDGQLVNYLLFSAMTVIGFYMKKINVKNILVFSLVVPTVYFALSNFYVWITVAGLNRPKTFEGLMMTYTDALPFYRNSIIATLVFSAVLFGSWVALQPRTNRSRLTIASR